MINLRICRSVLLATVLLSATGFEAQAQAPSSLSSRIPRRFALGADSVLESVKPDLGPYYIPGSSYGVSGEGRQVPGLQAIQRTNFGNELGYDGKDSYANPELLSGVPVASKGESQNPFSHRIPIVVPPGINGVQPDLALVYNPNVGNGFLGVGWQLDGLSAITRVNYGRGINYDGYDTYSHSDLGILMHQEDRTYRTQKESFSRFVASGDCGDGPCSWTMYDRSGRRYEYGLTDNSRLRRGTGSNTGSVRTWALEKVVDSFGNSYDVRYESYVVNSFGNLIRRGNGAHGKLYPDVITYTNRPSGEAQPTKRAIEFTYETRTDKESGYYQLVFQSMICRLRLITIKTGITEANSTGSQVRAYRLFYGHSPENGTGALSDSPVYSASTSRSRLTAVQEYGSNGGVLPAQTFEWQDGGSGVARYSWNAGTVNPVFIAGDFNGDGLSDTGVTDGGSSGQKLFYLPATFSMKLANGNGFIEQGWPLTGLNATFPDRDCLGPLVGDFNGDGKTDLACTGDLGTYVFLSTGSGFAPAQCWSGTRQDGKHAWAGDFDGDGKTDIAITHGSVFIALISTGTGFAQSQWSVPFYSGTGTPLGIGDFNGDGKTDYISIDANDSGNHIKVAISTGSGFATRYLEVPDTIPAVSQPVLLGDFNGDGNGDVAVVCDAGTVCIYSSTGYSFTPVSRVQLPNYTAFVDGIAVGDFNGDRKDDIATGPPLNSAVFLNLSTGNSFRQLPYIETGTKYRHMSGHVGDFTGQGKKTLIGLAGTNQIEVFVPTDPMPDLIIAVNNGRGGRVEVEYKPAAQKNGAIVTSNLDDTAIANTHPRALVTRITTSDGHGGLYWTDYDYIGGRIKRGTIPLSRDLGFAFIARRDGRTAESVTTLYYQQQPYERMVKEVVVWPATGPEPVSHTSYTYAICPDAEVCPTVIPGDDTELVLERQSTTTEYEGAVQSYQHTMNYLYDEYANVAKITRIDDGRPQVTVDIAYKPPDSSLYRIDRVREIKVTDSSSGAQLKDLAIGWDGSKVTQKSEWLDTTNTMLVTTFPSYDDFGHVLRVIEPQTADGVQRVTAFDYSDDPYRVHVTKVTNALGQETKARYYDDGSLQWVQDANGDATRTNYTYDEFGRKKTESRPDGGTTVYDYLLSDLPGPVSSDPNNPTAAALANRAIFTLDSQRSLVRYEYFDGTGFVYWTTAFIVCASGQDCTGIPQEPEIVVQHLKDTAGRPWKTSKPYYPSEAVKWTTTEYDARSRVKKVTTPDSKETKYWYDFDASAGGAYVSVTDPNGKVTRTYVNSRKSVAKVVAAYGTSLQQETNYGYDALERPISMTPPGQPALTFTYDSMGRRRTYTDPQLGSRPVTFTYDALNRVKTQKMEGGNTVILDYDDPSMSNGVGRLTKVTDASGTTHFGYTTMGQLKSLAREVEGGQTLTQTYAYNYAGQTTRVIYPDPQSSYIDYAYTMGGNLWKVTLRGATNVATWSNYTSAGKPQNVAYGNNVVSTVYGYDDMDHLTSVNTANSTTTLQNLTYDWYSRPNTGGIHLGQIFDNRTSAEKDATGVLSDESQAYNYDDLYRLTYAQFAWDAKYYLGYNAIGNMTRFGGLADRTLAFDGQLLTSITSNGTTGQVIHDVFGNMTHKEMGGNSWDYTWTNENFLWKVSKNGAPTAEMTYDAWGQRAKKVYTGGGSNVTTLYFGKTYEKRTYSNSATALHTIYIYANGQVIAQETVQGSGASAFNSPGRWRGEVAAASLYNGYNFKGAIQKVHHYLNAAALHPRSAQWVILISFLLFATGVLAMLVTSQLSKTDRRSSYSPALLGASLLVLMIFTLSACGGGSPGGGFHSSVGNQVGGNTLQGPSVGTFFYLRNQVNSTTVVTRDDGSEVSRHIYMPFGEMMQDHSSGGDAVTRKFTGQERDEETDLDYFNARYYDPAIGRFISADTIIPDVMNGMAFNRYAYVLNNPVMHEDPDGRNPLIIAGLACGGAAALADAIRSLVTDGRVDWSSAAKWGAAGFLIGVSAGVGYKAALGKTVTDATIAATANTDAVAAGAGTAAVATAGSGSLMPMADAAYQGTMRVVAGYELAGTVGLSGSTYNVNAWGLYATEKAQGLFALVNALKTEAAKAGATRISITGNAIINKGLMSAAEIAGRLGLEFTRVNDTTILLQGAVEGAAE